MHAWLCLDDTWTSKFGRSQLLSAINSQRRPHLLVMATANTHVFGSLAGGLSYAHISRLLLTGVYKWPPTTIALFPIPYWKPQGSAGILMSVLNFAFLSLMILRSSSSFIQICLTLLAYSSLYFLILRFHSSCGTNSSFFLLL
jgi:hypothetical protein